MGYDRHYAADGSDWAVLFLQRSNGKIRVPGECSRCGAWDWVQGCSRSCFLENILISIVGIAIGISWGRGSAPVF